MNNYVKTLSALGLIGLALVEGYSSKPYFDLAGVPTNGFGNATIEPTKPVTVEKALADLNTNTQTAQAGVRQCVTADVTQGQFDAYTSLAYNIGTSAFCKSSIVRYANEGNKQASCDSIMKYVFVGKKDCRIPANKCSGIVKRREMERKTCME